MDGKGCHFMQPLLGFQRSPFGGRWYIIIYIYIYDDFPYATNDDFPYASLPVIPPQLGGLVSPMIE